MRKRRRAWSQRSQGKEVFKREGTITRMEHERSRKMRELPTGLDDTELTVISAVFQRGIWGQKT